MALAFTVKLTYACRRERLDAQHVHEPLRGVQASALLDAHVPAGHDQLRPGVGQPLLGDGQPRPSVGQSLFDGMQLLRQGVHTLQQHQRVLVLRCGVRGGRDRH